MANRHGDFIWYELLTSDTGAAERFYGAVLGWRARRAEGVLGQAALARALNERGVPTPTGSGA